LLPEEQLVRTFELLDLSAIAMREVNSMRGGFISMTVVGSFAVLEPGKIRSLNEALAGSEREAPARENAPRITRASGQTRVSAHRPTKAGGQTRGNARMRDSSRLPMRESGVQLPKIRLSVSKPRKMRRIRVSKAPTAVRKVVRILRKTRNRVTRSMSRISSRVLRITDRMPNKAARNLQIITQIPTERPALMVPGTAAVRPVPGAATTLERLPPGLPG
jgi:hypothetical protein